jgi:hypothetical protein
MDESFWFPDTHHHVRAVDDRIGRQAKGVVSERAPRPVCDAGEGAEDFISHADYNFAFLATRIQGAIPRPLPGDMLSGGSQVDYNECARLAEHQ